MEELSLLCLEKCMGGGGGVDKMDGWKWGGEKFGEGGKCRNVFNLVSKYQIFYLPVS
jgi:hypothetical protein